MIVSLIPVRMEDPVQTELPHIRAVVQTVSQGITVNLVINIIIKNAYLEIKEENSI